MQADLDQQLIARIRAGNPDNSGMAALRYLATRWASLPARERRTLRDAIVRWLGKAPGESESISEALGDLQATTVDREPLVRAFLRSSHADIDVEAQVQAMVGAYRLARSSKPLQRLCTNGLEGARGSELHQAVSRILRANSP